MLLVYICGLAIEKHCKEPTKIHEEKNTFYCKSYFWHQQKGKHGISYCSLGG
jgi:hypothetical protein